MAEHNNEKLKHLLLKLEKLRNMLNEKVEKGKETSHDEILRLSKNGNHDCRVLSINGRKKELGVKLK